MRLKRALGAAALCLSAALLCGCAAQRAQTREVFAMDTVMTLTVYGRGAEQALDEAQRELARLDALLSAHADGSDIARLNAAGGGRVQDETAELIARALEITAQTDGAYDPTLLPLTRAWGFADGVYRVPEQAELDTLLARTGWARVRADGAEISLPDGVQLDLGGIGKGWAAAQLRTLLRQSGVESAVLSLGGNVAVIGDKPDGSPWRIAIADPEQPETWFCTVQAADAAIVTSGGYQRCFTQDGETYWHILDPETGRPARSGMLSVSIICADDTLADGLSTALFVMGPERAAAFWRAHADEFDAVWMTDARQIFITQGLEGRFSCEERYEVIQK